MVQILTSPQAQVIQQAMAECPCLAKGKRLGYSFMKRADFEANLPGEMGIKALLPSIVTEVVYAGHINDNKNIGRPTTTKEDGERLAGNYTKIIRGFNHFFDDNFALVFGCDSADSGSEECVMGFAQGWHLGKPVIFLQQ